MKKINSINLFILFLSVTKACTMKKITFLFLFLLFVSQVYTQNQNNMLITGVFDGPLAGGTPKAIEVYVLNDISDLSTYGLGNATNGGGTDGQEFTFPEVSATAGDFLYIASETSNFNAFFGFDPNHISSVANINGDDAIELFQNGQVIDTFGEISYTNSGDQNWLYTDGWAYRDNNTVPDGNTFVISHWTFSGVGENDDDPNQNSATNPWPIGTFSSTLNKTAFNRLEINLYPNPVSNGILNIQSTFEDDLNIQLFNRLGQLVLTSKASKSINVSNLRSGVYLVKINHGPSSLTKKIIIN